MAENRRTWRTHATCAAASSTLVVALAMLAVEHGAGAAQACRSTTLRWAPTTTLVLSMFNQQFDTGLVVEAGAPDEVLQVTESHYSSYDRYPDGTSPSRSDADQAHEQWGLRIGGQDFGGLTADVPDLESEGAPSPWFSGDISGTLGTGEVRPGNVVLRHGSLSGYTESPNSVRPSSLSITVSYCRDVVDDTTTTSPAPTTAEPPVTTVSIPATSDPSSTVPVTTAPTPEIGTAPTTVLSTVPTTAPATVPPAPVPTPAAPSPAVTTTIVAVPTTAGASTTSPPPPPTDPAVPTTTPTATTVPDGTLPSTGGEVGFMLRAAAALSLLGGLLLIARRRVVIG